MSFVRSERLTLDFRLSCMVVADIILSRYRQLEVPSVRSTHRGLSEGQGQRLLSLWPAPQGVLLFKGSDSLGWRVGGCSFFHGGRAIKIKHC